MAAVSQCSHLSLGRNRPDGLLLRYCGCQSVLGPSGSRLRCRGRGDSTPCCWSASPVAALGPVWVHSHVPTVYVSVWKSRQTADWLICLHFIGDKYTAFCNWAVLQYIEERVSCATQHIILIFALTEKVSSNQLLIHISPFSWHNSDISIIGCWFIASLTLHIAKWHSCLMSTTPHLTWNDPLKHEWIVVHSATRKKVCCR